MIKLIAQVSNCLATKGTELAIRSMIGRLPDISQANGMWQTSMESTTWKIGSEMSTFRTTMALTAADGVSTRHELLRCDRSALILYRHKLDQL
ncbi:hypothetical protein G997_04753 [Escherichia coli UMEA 3834-1]|nr:hypothetical protein G997_04753 [Escherichia coli UMEA 3834-1]